MYYMRMPNTIYRNYDEFGYITDNRNFEYRLLDDHKNFIGDRIVSLTGNIFLSVLDRKPTSIDRIVEEVHSFWNDIDVEVIKNDVIDFYEEFIKEGFIVKGDSPVQCYDNAKSVLHGKCFNSGLNVGRGDKTKTYTTEQFFDKYFFGEPILRHLHIEIASQCNERCIHCYIPHNYKNCLMDKDLFYDILAQAKEMNVLNLTISGGEPMLHPAFINFLRRCNEYNFSVNILSNLTLLNEAIVDEIRKNPLICIQTSIYSMNPKVHDAITHKRGSLKHTIQAVLELQKNNIPIQISCPIMKQNIDEYVDVIDWGKRHNIRVNSDYVIIGQYNCLDDNLSCRLDLSEVRKVIAQMMCENRDYVEHIEKEYKIKQNIDLEDSVCSVCRSSLCISEQGIVYPCAGWQSYILGDIKDINLNSIWKNSNKIKLLRNIKRKDFSECIECKQKDFCTMCMVRNANESFTGNPFEINEYFCNVVALNKELFEKTKRKSDINLSK